MYDPTFHPATLKREITHGDKLRNNKIYDQKYLSQLLETAKGTADSGYKNLDISKTKANRANVYSLVKLSDELVLRKVGRNIKHTTKARQANRSSIVNCISVLASEGVAFRVYKIDIRKFFESINPELFLLPITADTAFPPSTVKVLASFFAQTQLKGIEGLPRGLALSSILSEYVMRDFDNKVSQFAEVCFYARFVDDIVFITCQNEKSSLFLRKINKSLPRGLKLNASKTKFIDFGSFKKLNSDSVENEFDFLGYVFRVFYCVKDNKKHSYARRVEVDISRKKLIRIKTRLNISLQRFLRDYSFEDLVDRIRMLTCNYVFKDVKTNTRRRAGIYHSYQLIDPETSTGLKELDVFYRKILLSGSGPLCQQLKNRITPEQRKKLLCYSFENGFKKRIYFQINPDRLSKLRRCWANA